MIGVIDGPTRVKQLLVVFWVEPHEKKVQDGVKAVWVGGREHFWPVEKSFFSGTGRCGGWEGDRGGTGIGSGEIRGRSGMRVTQK